jgi:hypothetical protein
MTTDEPNIKLTYFVNEIKEDNNEINIDDFLFEIENNQLNDELTLPQIINYNENYIVKELFIICEYYGFAKDLKSNKCNKEEIIQFLVEFERNQNNSDIVFRRQNMWFYINELKNDKIMKKYVLW